MHTGLVDGRSRKSSAAGQQQQHPVTPGTNTPGEEHHQIHPSAPITYFFADEATVAASAASGSASSNFGSRGLAASVEESDLRCKKPPSLAEYSRASCTEGGEGVDVNDGEDDEADQDEEDEDGRGLDERSIASFQSSAHPEFRSPHGLLSVPLTPILGPHSDPESPRSASGVSYRSEDMRSEQGAESSARRPSFTSTKEISQETLDAPQLIMPEITIPSRRPFTDKGKRIGKLKVLIAGDSGIGKTSLIKSIVQVCEDIVHVDPISSNSCQTGARAGSSYYAINSRSNGDSTKDITEVYASTRPYPHWWSELDDSRLLRKRRSKPGIDDQVIERNLCFVDTPGYGVGTSFLECVEPVVRYVEGQLERTRAIVSGNSGDLLPLLSGDGTPQVDIVFYAILHRVKPVDIDFIRRLSPFTSVLPILAKADTLTPQQVQNLKLSILNDLRGAGVRPFLFGKTFPDVSRSMSENMPCAPFAISSALSSDSENMDASLLMSPDYVAPLVGSELSELVGHVFDPDNIAWLRHASAKKYIQWSNNATTPNRESSLTRLNSTPGSPRSMRSTSASVLLSASNSSLIHIPDSGSQVAANNFALARVADHTQREERLAQVRLTRWAHDLQRSLKAERERYERLARGERAIWLTERLGECIADGQLVPASMPLANKYTAVTDTQDGMVNARDPLGLLALNENVRRKAVRLLRIAGYGGIVGFVSLWVLKQSGLVNFQGLK
ncbi:Septin-domain-containing protein [Tuber indicum]|nr:Septin-domain-containing protein [Tuber indicum]